MVRLLLESVTAEQKMFVLAKPRQALGHASAAEPKSWDPRLSSLGNRLSKQLAALLDRLAGMENFLECRGWTSLMASDRLVLGPIFERLARDAHCVADGAGDLAVEMRGGNHERHPDSRDRRPVPRRRVDAADRPEPADQPPQSAAGARTGRARSYRRDDAGAAPAHAAPRQPAGRHTRRRSPTCWRAIPTSRPNESTRNCAGSVTRGATRSSASGCGRCVRVPSSHPCGGSRPAREYRRKWITPLTTSISPTKDAAGCTPSATYWVTRAGSTCTSSRVRISPRPSASTSAPSSTWAESRRLVFMTT